MESEISAAFTLTGPDLDPEHVTHKTGLAPSKTWRAGDLIQKPATIRYEHSGWRLKSQLPPSAGIEEHIRWLIERLAPSWEALKELGGRYRSEFSCTVYSYGGDRPAIHFASDVLTRAADLSAAIDVDLYVMSERRKARKED
jgi:hypothetical protein